MEIKNCSNCQHLEACSNIMTRYAGMEKSTDGPACGNYEETAKFAPGDEVWVIERDEEGTAVYVSGYLYMASVPGAVIVTPYIGGCDTFEDMVQYHIQQMVSNYNTELCVFPSSDCYQNKDEADSALDNEIEEEQ